MLENFHKEDIEKHQFYVFIMIAITILSLGSSIHFISVKLKWFSTDQPSRPTSVPIGENQHGRQIEETSPS